jgi:hypothetical protein
MPRPDNFNFPRKAVGVCPIIQVILSLMLILSKGGIITAIGITGSA